MPTPTHVKTWLFSIDNNILTSGTSFTDRRALMFAIKQGLIGSGAYVDSANAAISLANPMTVIGTSNATTSNMTGTDLLTSASTLVQNSWFVLQDNAVTAKFQICFQLIGTAWGAGGTPQLTVKYSKAAGFGTANGGTNGNATTMPTATDEVTILSAGTAPGGAAAASSRLYLMRSSDGKFTYIAVRDTTTSTMRVMWYWGVPLNTPSAWVNPHVIKIAGDAATVGSPVLTSNTIYTQNGAIVVSTGYLHVGAPAGDPNLINQANDFSGATEWDTWGLKLTSTTVLAKGAEFGDLPDSRAGASSIAVGSRLPSSAPFRFAAIGDTGAVCFLLPWPNTTVKLTVTP